jgi:hypothetical protein
MAAHESIVMFFKIELQIAVQKTPFQASLG